MLVFSFLLLWVSTYGLSIPGGPSECSHLRPQEVCICKQSPSGLVCSPGHLVHVDFLADQALTCVLSSQVVPSGSSGS